MSLCGAGRRDAAVFPLTTGHFAGPWVPSIRGVLQKYPDLIKKAVAALTVEHLACREWLIDASMHYKPTGKYEWSVAISPNRSTGMIMAEALRGSVDRAAAVNPVNGGWLGEGGGLSRAGVPTIGYIPQPNYLLAGPANCCIDKLSRCAQAAGREQHRPLPIAHGRQPRTSRQHCHACMCVGRHAS